MSIALFSLVSFAQDAAPVSAPEQTPGEVQAPAENQTPAERPNPEEKQVSVLKPCPDKPNCVTSIGDVESKKMPMLTFNGELAAAKEAIKQIVLADPRTELLTENDDYLHFVYKSKVLGFKDDVEFSFDSEAKVIHFRSASQTGYSDFGVNRKRMEALSKKFVELNQKQDQAKDPS